MIKKTFINDTTYSSLAEAAGSFGLESKLVRTRLSRGWSLEESLQIKKRPDRKPARSIPVSLETNEGLRQFDSIKEAAAYFGLNPSIVRARLRKFGWSLEQALGIVAPEKRKAHNRISVDITVDSVKYNYDSISEAAKARGLSEFLVFRRINRDGWSLEQALELVPLTEHMRHCYGYIYIVTNLKNDKKYIGQTMRTIQNRWEQHVMLVTQKSKINKNSLLSAIMDFGHENFKIEQVAVAATYAELNLLERYWIKKLNTIAPNGYNLNRGGSGIITGQSVLVEGITYPSISAAAREYDFYDRLILDRLRYGWSIEQALEITTPPESHKFAGRNIKIQIDKKEHVFKSIADLARFFDLPVSTVSQRIIKLNWTAEEAVGLVPPRKWVHPMHELSLVINGKEKHFVSKAEVATKYGFKRWSTIEKRLKRNWTTEQALSLVAPPKNKFFPVEIQVNIDDNVVTYFSQVEAARAHGISFKKVSARRKIGWSFEEALEIIPRKASA